MPDGRGMRQGCRMMDYLPGSHKKLCTRRRHNPVRLILMLLLTIYGVRAVFGVARAKVRPSNATATHESLIT